MTTFLIIVLAILCLLALVSLIRGIVAFLKSTKIDLEKGEAENVPEMQMLQNKMMFNRIKYQALAIVVVAILLALSR
jgi:Na+-transporting methylmalonyl-CoA/oxaloacetate decarboxylase gamma subunit